jgi:hypothetical protein
MSTKWTVTRTTAAHNNGQLRWDTAYQLLLRWAPSEGTDSLPVSSPTEEDKDGNCPICPRLHNASATDTDN